MEKMDDKTKEIVNKIYDLELSMLEEQSFIDILKDYCEQNADCAKEIGNIDLLIDTLDEKHKISRDKLEELIVILQKAL